MNQIQPNAPSVNPRVDYNSCEEFSHLNRGHKALVIVISIFAGLFTLGLALPFAVPAMISKFRKMEINESSKQAQAAKKANEALKNAFQAKKEGIAPAETEIETDTDSLYGIENPDDIPPEVLVALQEEADKERIISSFWADYDAVDKMIEELKLPKEQPGSANMVYKKYNEYKQKQAEEKKKEDPSHEGKFVITIEDMTLILDQIEIILEKKADPLIFPVKIKNEQVDRCNTVGDGSCAFHALLGNPVQNVYRCDAIEARKTFCEFLQRAFDNKKLPISIQNVLDDYFLNPETAPEEFIKSLKVTRGKGKAKKTIDLLQFYKSSYNAINITDKALSKSEKAKRIAEQDKIKDKFKESPQVFRAYLNHIKKNRTYLLQDELVAVAECFNKRIRLFQRGWGNDLNLGEEILNKDGAEEVCIYYTGQFGRMKKHFERAIVRPIKENPADHMDVF